MNDDDGQSLVGQRADQLMNFGDGADVDAPSGSSKKMTSGRCTSAFAITTFC